MGCVQQLPCPALMGSANADTSRQREEACMLIPHLPSAEGQGTAVFLSQGPEFWSGSPRHIAVTMSRFLQLLLA